MERLKTKKKKKLEKVKLQIYLNSLLIILENVKKLNIFTLQAVTLKLSYILKELRRYLLPMELLAHFRCSMEMMKIA